MRILMTVLALLLSSTLLWAQLAYDPVTNGMPVIGFATPAGSGAEGQPHDVTVVIDQPSSLQVTVNYTVSGSAQNGADFSLADSTLTIPPGQTSGTITIPVVDDVEVEGDETISIILSNPQGAAFGTSVYTYMLRDNDHYKDNDTPPTPPLLQVQGRDGQKVTLAFDHRTSIDATVDYIITSTPTGSNQVYQLGSGTLSFPSGSTQASLDIPSNTDSIEQAGIKTISVYFNNPQNLVIVNPLYSYTQN